MTDEPKVVKIPVGNGDVVELHGQAPQEDKPKTAEGTAGEGLGANPLLPQTAPPATLPTPVYAPAPAPAHSHASSPTVIMKMPPGSEPESAPAEPVGLRPKAGMQSLNAPGRLYPANPTSQFRPAATTTTPPAAESGQ